MNPTVYFVIPCYNEEEVQPETVRRLSAKLDAMRQQGLANAQSRMLLVDDGSRDKTWQLITRLNQENMYVEGVKLAHNRGHQNALLCGLMTAMDSCDCAISLDADLQDDVDKNIWRAATWCTVCATSGTRTPGLNAPPPRGSIR